MMGRRLAECDASPFALIRVCLTSACDCMQGEGHVKEPLFPLSSTTTRMDVYIQLSLLLAAIEISLMHVTYCTHSVVLYFMSAS